MGGDGCGRARGLAASRGSRRGRHVVAHREERAVAQVEPLHLGAVERARADAVEDRDLVAALVDGAVAVEPLRERYRRAVGVARGDRAAATGAG